ncbi:MAG: VIT1/CCC1 transporter family protein [Hyphomicrobiaceae bacterium]
MPLEHEHTPEAIEARLNAGQRPNYLRDFVYGGIDGAVTTFAVVSGVSGAELSDGIVIILGVANLLADGFSMAASNYSGTKTEIDDANRLRAVEEKHIRLEPDGEREEIRQIMAGKGLSGDTLEGAVEAITGDKKVWVDTMLSDEYGLATSQRSPLTSAVATFAAFLVCGGVPLLPFLFDGSEPFAWSLAMTTAVFFAIGSAKSRWSLAPWWWSGLESTAIGLVAAGVAYLAGYLLGGLA